MKVGFTASSFDLGPHAGHVRMLTEAKQNCDYLIVGLQVNASLGRDWKNSTLPSVSQRYQVLKALNLADEIIPYESEEELLNILLAYPIKVRFLGEDYLGKDFTGRTLSQIEIHYCSRKHSYSSSNLREQVVKAKKQK